MMKIALVTGASRGIGRATALELSKSGCAVAVHYSHNRDLAEGLVSEITSANGRAISFQADLSDSNSARKLVATVTRDLGAPDILINNAGAMTDASVAEMSDEIWDQAIEINLSSAFRVTRECISAMVEKKWGRIISISSQVAFTGSANHAHYSAAKAGLLGFTYSLAKELGPSGITVNSVLPGRISTDMISERSQGRMEEWLAQTPLRRLGTSQEVAGAIAFLASEKASYITGAALNVNGGLVMG